ncbi:MAG: hypothetical protein QME27_09535, partial [Syntrophaceae bacterium]|nr:hypothetical protein [Syntrophaceae bacterium]
MFDGESVIEEKFLPKHPHVDKKIDIFSPCHVRVEGNAGENLFVYDHIAAEDKGRFLDSGATADYLLEGLIHS